MSSHFAVQDRTVVTNDGVDYYAERFDGMKAGFDRRGSGPRHDPRRRRRDNSLRRTSDLSVPGSGLLRANPITKNYAQSARTRRAFAAFGSFAALLDDDLQARSDADRQVRRPCRIGGLSPRVTANRLGKFLGTPASGEGMNEWSTNKDAGRSVVISFGKLDVDTKRRVAEEIHELARPSRPRTLDGTQLRATR